MKQFDQMKNVLLNALHQPRKKSLSRVIFHAALALLLPIQVAQGNELSAARCQYEQIKDGHPDGIFKRYCGRQIARIMGWEGADWLERPERKTEEGLDQLIDRLQLKPGMQVGDIGAGTGRLSILMVDRIKPDGQVWAVDVQPEMVKYLVARATKLGKNQLNVALSSETSPNIPAAKLDLAVMVDVYHELEFPREFLRNLMKSVKPGGQVVFVEYRANDRAVPIKPLHTMTIDQVKKEALDAGLLFERADSSLPWQHVVFFRTPTQLSK